jgi:hypothetical protein
MILDKNTINTENFCDLTLAEYWEMYRFVIADERGWDCKSTECPSFGSGCSKFCADTQQREHICGTLRTYTRYIRLLQESLGKKSICEISLGDIRCALESVQNETGWADETMRTVQSYRTIPVHFELAQLLNDRYQFVLAQLGRGVSSLINRPMDSEIAELPICCMGNNFHQYCRDYEVALSAEYVFSQQLRLPQRDMYIYLLDSLIEQRNSGKGILSGISEQDQQLTLYVLRRNYWTWTESSTRLSDHDKRFLMGHEMDLDGRSQRSAYNDENRLWEMLQKMDRCVLSKELHQQNLYATPAKGQPIFIEDRGLVRIIITKDMLQSGGTLSINVTTTEAGDTIELKALSPIRKLGGLTVHTEVVSYPKTFASDVGINCEYENWLAHQAPSRIFLDSNKTQYLEEPVPE